ncbi:tyrosine-type recombinase/integrase [Alcanivorax sp. IL3]|uniref:tyrosine-type recombinase/integrase n=1 Tax=unclassified Alcanivorax TaxID=2638842 RepID=UPI0039C08DE6
MKFVHTGESVALSDTWLKANSGKLREKTEERADRDGLSVRLSPKGKVTWQIRYRYGGKPQRLDLGTYPLLGLKDAREESHRLRAKLEQGYDPRVVRQVERQAIITADSLEQLFRQWYQAYCVKNKKGHREVLRSFELYVLPAIGALPARDVTLHQWLDLLEQRAQSSPSIAERLLTNAKQMYKWALRRRLVEQSPLSDIQASHDLQIKKATGSRTLAPEEIRMMWMAADQSRMAPKNKLFLKLCLVYGCRNGELRLSEKAHFDFDNKIWTVPQENHKLGKMTGKPLVRPIVPDVEPLLREAFQLSGRGKYLFNNAGTSQPMGKSSPLALPYNVMQWLRRHKGYEMAHWSVHDLRRTARTNFSELTEPHVAEIMLGHKLPGHWQVYDHYDYLKEQGAAYRKWWARLAQIVGQD